jgi:transcriptional regulator with XRE-family HTH domain
MATANGAPATHNEAPATHTLKDRRTAAGLTQQAAASAAGLSISAIAKLEAGAVAAPSYDTVAALAGVYGVTPEEIAEAIRASVSEAAA